VDCQGLIVVSFFAVAKYSFKFSAGSAGFGRLDRPFIPLSREAWLHSDGVQLLAAFQLCESSSPRYPSSLVEDFRQSKATASPSRTRASSVAHRGVRRLVRQQSRSQ